MSIRRTIKDIILLDAQTTTTAISAGINVSDFRTLVLMLGATGAAAGTIKIQGAIGATVPDFTSGLIVGVGTVDAPWTHIEGINLETGTAVDGDTGFTFAAADVVLVEVNTNGLDWLSVHSTDVTGGAFTVKATLYDNQ